MTCFTGLGISSHHFALQVMCSHSFAVLDMCQHDFAVLVMCLYCFTGPVLFSHFFFHYSRNVFTLLHCSYDAFYSSNDLFDCSSHRAYSLFPCCTDTFCCSYNLH